MPRGRPAISPEQRKAHNLTFRVRGSFRARLAAAAEESARSMSEEAEMRINDSFNLPEVIRKTVLLTINEVFGDNDAQET